MGLYVDNVDAVASNSLQAAIASALPAVRRPLARFELHLADVQLRPQEIYPRVDYDTSLVPAVVVMAIFMGSMIAGGLQPGDGPLPRRSRELSIDPAPPLRHRARRARLGNDHHDGVFDGRARERPLSTLKAVLFRNGDLNGDLAAAGQHVLFLAVFAAAMAALAVFTLKRTL